MKKILITLISGILILTTSACGSNTHVYNNNESNNNGTSVNDNDSSNEKEETKKAVDVKIGQNIQYDDNFNISFQSSLFTDKLNPSKPDSFYHYYEVKDSSNTNFVLKTNIKNLGTETLEGDKLPDATLIYDGKYKYEMQLITEEDDGSDLQGYDWYMDIDPLKTKKIFYMVEVPDEVETNTSASLVVQYEIDSTIYNVVVR